MTVSRVASGKGQRQISEQSGNSLSRSYILRVKTRALRRGVWFRVLSRIERACVDLVARVVERVRSLRLGEILLSILSKLEDSMRNHVQFLMCTEASNLALRLSQIAQQWGNRSASRWILDVGFVRFLAILRLNNSEMFEG